MKKGTPAVVINLSTYCQAVIGTSQVSGALHLIRDRQVGYVDPKERRVLYQALKEIYEPEVTDAG